LGWKKVPRDSPAERVPAVWGGGKLESWAGVKEVNLSVGVRGHILRRHLEKLTGSGNSRIREGGGCGGSVRRVFCPVVSHKMGGAEG